MHSLASCLLGRVFHGSGQHQLLRPSSLHLLFCCRYNTTQYFWSSTRYTRGDCQWRIAAALPGEQDFVSSYPPS